MRRACNVVDDSLQVTYYASGSNISVIVHAKNGEIQAIRIFTSLEAFIWALILEEKEVTA